MPLRSNLLRKDLLMCCFPDAVALLRRTMIRQPRGDYSQNPLLRFSRFSGNFISDKVNSVRVVSESNCIEKKNSGFCVSDLEKKRTEKQRA